MARIGKVVQQPYNPTNPPDEFQDWPRWLMEELFRIAGALRSDPVVMAVDDTDTITIGTLPTTVILGIGDASVIDIPSGAWDPVTGIWTCPLDGIYQVTAQVYIPAFGSGNKTYFGSIEVNELAPNPKRIAVSFDGGADDVPLGITLAEPNLILAGTTIQATLTAEHEQFTGTVNYIAAFSYLRQASA